MPKPMILNNRNINFFRQNVPQNTLIQLDLAGLRRGRGYGECSTIPS